MKNKLPLVLACVVAIIAGIITSIKLSGPADTGTAEQATANPAALSALQETLATSIALPLDFKTVPDFSLLDVDAAELTQAVFEDKWSIVFFGYTHCPDVCPITLQVMKNVVTKLEEQNKEAPQIVFMSVDPVRDTSEIMKNYISFFNEDFVGITGDVNSVHSLTRSLGIVASFTANAEDPENYIVDHTASLLLIDPQKRVRGKITPPHEAATIAADYVSISEAVL